MKKTLLGAVSAVALLGAASLALAQTPPQVSAIGPTDLFQDVVGGYGQVQSWFVNALTLANYAATQPGNNPENAIVGGDFSTNLFQDGTSVGSVAGTITYVADQWAAWGGTTTVITGTQQADAPAGYLDSLRINKASGTGGTVPACVVQEIPSANSYRFQGQTAEFDFHAKAGAGFSSATSALAVSIVYGTGTDEGVSKLAYAFNAGGGGSSTWTGQTNAASNLAVPITTAWQRYTVAAPIPATATEIAAVICYTPVGNGGSTDWYEFTAAQLVPNTGLTSVVGTAGVVLPANDGRAKVFLRRSAQDEALRQYYFYYKLNEGAAATIVGNCSMTTSGTAAACLVPLPTAMRVAPTVTAGAGFALPTTTGQTALNNCTGLGLNATLGTILPSTLNLPITCTNSSGTTAALGISVPLFHNGGSGYIKATARF